MAKFSIKIEIDTELLKDNPEEKQKLIDELSMSIDQLVEHASHIVEQAMKQASNDLLAGKEVPVE